MAPAWAAMEAICRAFSAELAAYEIRSACLCSTCLTLYSFVLFAHITSILALGACLSLEVVALFHLRASTLTDGSPNCIRRPLSRTRWEESHNRADVDDSPGPLTSHDR
jgi:hypothetical protein